MTAIVSVVSGTTGAAVATGFFGLRKNRMDTDASDRAQLWKRISEMEGVLREQEKYHRTEIARIEARYEAKIALLEQEIKNLNNASDNKDKEILKLQTDLAAAQLEIQVLRTQLHTGAGSLPKHITTHTEGTHSSGGTDSWKVSSVISPATEQVAIPPPVIPVPTPLEPPATASK